MPSVEMSPMCENLFSKYQKKKKKEMYKPDVS